MGERPGASERLALTKFICLDAPRLDKGSFVTALREGSLRHGPLGFGPVGPRTVRQTSHGTELFRLLAWSPGSQQSFFPSEII